MIYRPKLDWLNEKFDKKARTSKDYSWPKITIITPSYNQGQFIEDTIKSVLCQNYPNLEYLIFDGGSDDNTVEIIKKYEEYIDFWVSEKDKGQSDAINKGFRKATGDIVGWLNSDDLFYPYTLNKIANLYKTDKTYNKVYFGECDYLFDKYNFCIQNHTAKLSTDYALDLCDFIIQPSCFWGKEIIDQVGLLNEELHYGFDWEWFIRIQKAGIPFQFVKDNFSTYRIHADHKSSSAGDKRVKELAKIYARFHNDNVANSYIQLHDSKLSRIFRKLGKYLPVGSNMIRWMHWKLFFKQIDFQTFKSIANM